MTLLWLRHLQVTNCGLLCVWLWCLHGALLWRGHGHGHGLFWDALNWLLGSRVDYGLADKFLGVGPDLGSSSGAYMLLDPFPIFAVECKAFLEFCFFEVCPTSC